MKTDFTIHTDGSGLWSREARTVRITSIRLNYLDADDPNRLFGELHVKFHPDDWDVNQHGLIYTDDQWLKELQGQLIQLGLRPAEADALDYSEQGMQGKDHVSLDAGHAFCTSELGRRLRKQLRQRTRKA
jgi:hypothetical protein